MIRNCKDRFYYLHYFTIIFKIILRGQILQGFYDLRKLFKYLPYLRTPNIFMK